MSALDEIWSGHPGRSTFELVISAGARVVGAFPPPDGYGGWSRDAIAEEVNALFVAKPHVLTMALEAGVADDDALEAYVMAAIKHHLIDQAKGTDVGKLRRRFVNVLAEDPRFVHSTMAGETWVLAEFDGAVRSGELRALHAAAARVRGVFIERLNKAGPTPGPVADALRTVTAAVLAEARGAVTAQDLARVVFDRFFPAGEPTVYLDAPRSEQIADTAPGPEAKTLANAAARALFTTLGEKEKALLPHLGKAPEERAGLLEDTGPHETEALAAAVAAKIRAAVQDDTDADDVVLALRDMCRNAP